MPMKHYIMKEKICFEPDFRGLYTSKKGGNRNSRKNFILTS